MRHDFYLYFLYWLWVYVIPVPVCLQYVVVFIQIVYLNVVSNSFISSQLTLHNIKLKWASFLRGLCGFKVTIHFIRSHWSKSFGIHHSPPPIHLFEGVCIGPRTSDYHAQPHTAILWGCEKGMVGFWISLLSSCFHSLHNNLWHFSCFRPRATLWMSSRRNCLKMSSYIWAITAFSLHFLI